MREQCLPKSPGVVCMSLLQMQQKGLTVNSAEPGTELSTLVP